MATQHRPANDKRKVMTRIATLSSHGSIANGISMLRDHTPGGDHRCGVDIDVSACSSLLPGVCIYATELIYYY